MHRHVARERIPGPLLGAGPRWFLPAAALSAMVLWAAVAWSFQYRNGLGMTGLNRPVFWGMYVVNFSFLIGIGLVGAPLAAVLRLTGAGWRRPVTRIAELTTVLALMVGALNPLLHLGRPERFWVLLRHPHPASPIVWDFLFVNASLGCGMLYLYVGLIPDLSRAAGTSNISGPLFRLLSLGWNGSPRQERLRTFAIRAMSVVVIAVMVAAHAANPIWRVEIFGPRFPAGALLSGIAAVLLVMASARRLPSLRKVLGQRQFKWMGTLLIAACCFWFLFALAEVLSPESAASRARVSGTLAPAFWTMVLLCFAAPVGILLLPWGRKAAGAATASVLALAGTWADRYLTLVPTLARPPLSFSWGSYSPSWIEISVAAGEFALFGLLIMLFSRFFPMVPEGGRKEEPGEQRATRLETAATT